MTAPSTVADGEAFADGLYALVYQHGPKEMNRAQHDALAGALLETAIEWVKAHNRAVKRQRHNPIPSSPNGDPQRRDDP